MLDQRLQKKLAKFEKRIIFGLFFPGAIILYQELLSKSM